MITCCSLLYHHTFDWMNKVVFTLEQMWNKYNHVYIWKTLSEEVLVTQCYSDIQKLLQYSVLSQFVHFCGSVLVFQFHLTRSKNSDLSGFFFQYKFDLGFN